MKILFIGSVEFSEIILKKVLSLNYEVISIITKEKSKFNSDFKDLSYLAKEYNIDYKYVKNINHENYIKYIKEKSPDLILCFGWSQLLKKEILDIPKIGVIGYHPALLPKNKGRHPIIWALVLGLEKTGSTFFFMNENADDGEIISQEVVEIKYEDNARTLYDKLKKISLNQIENILNNIENNKIKEIKNNNFDENVWRKRSKKDGEIDWRMDSYNIYNLVRGLTHPYPGAHFIYEDKDYKVWEVEEYQYNKDNIEPGKIIDILKAGEIIVKTGDNAIKINNPKYGDNFKVGDYL
jgi:methionyl-tRNA formyltransferase